MILYRQAGLPVFQNHVFSTRQEALDAPRADIELVQDSDTGLVGNRSFDPRLMTYDHNYNSEQSWSPAYLSHLNKVAAFLKNTVRGKGVEIGSGTGHSFNFFVNNGLDLIGFDPAYTGSDPRILKTYFDPSAIDFRPNFILMRHVLEHIVNPWELLQDLSDLCAEGAKVYIEAPSFDWILRNKAFYCIFYEHVNYFTPDLVKMSFSSGAISESLFGDQYFAVVADLRSFRKPAATRALAATQLDFEGHIDTIVERCGDRSTYIWGAGARGHVLANILAGRNVAVEGLFDLNPSKQGRFVGGCGLPIRNPDNLYRDLRDALILMPNPNYEAEIKDLVGTEAVLTDLLP